LETSLKHEKSVKQCIAPFKSYLKYIYVRLSLKAKIKFGYGYGDAREFPYLGTSRVITLVKENEKGIDKSGCVALSKVSL